MSAVETLHTRLDELDVALFAKDASGSKIALTTLLEHATLHPLAVLQSLEKFETALGDENYSKRNAVVQILGAVVERMKDGERVKEDTDAMEIKESEQEGESDFEMEQDEESTPAEVAAKLAAKKAKADAAVLKDQAECKSHIIAMLHARVHDLNSFTRIKTLQQLLALVRAKSITSPEEYVATMRAAQNRLMDKTASVRKAAIQLLTGALEMNPFAPQLDLLKFRTILQSQADAFRDALAHAPVASVLKRLSMQPAVKEEEEAEPGSEEMKEDLAKPAVAAPDQSLKALLESAQVSDVALEKLQSELQFSFHAVTFITAYTHEIVPLLYELLNSKTSSDQIESVNFFVAAKQFQLSAPIDAPAEPVLDGEAASSQAPVTPTVARVTVDLACKKLAGLIWSRDQPVREAVLAAWVTLYLGDEMNSRSGPVAKKACLVSVNSLVHLVHGASLSELTSMEEICTKLYYAGHIPEILIHTLFELFASLAVDQTAEERTTFLMLINFFANASGKYLSKNAQDLVSVGFADTSLTNAPTLVRQACVSLQKWMAAIKNAPTPAEAPPAIPQSTMDVVYTRMRLALVQTTAPSAQVASGWYSMAESVLNTLYMMHPTPESYCESVLHELVRDVFKRTSADAPVNSIGNAEKLSRFLFLLAHTSMRTLVHLEMLEKEIKSIRSKKSAVQEMKEVEPVEDAPKKKGKKAAASASAAPAPVMATSIEDDLASMQAQEYELEQSREACEMELIDARAGACGLLSVFAPVVMQIVRSLPAYAAHRTLQCNAVMALCKLMVINVGYAEGPGAQEHLCLLFGVLKSPSTCATIKGNIIVAVGDLFLRFPNSVEPFSEHMYHGLSKHSTKSSKAEAASVITIISEGVVSDEVYVRKNTLMVLTHLILTDMLKAKGPLAELAKCTQDADSANPRIAQLSQAFFQELNNKCGDSKATIYNILPDILSRLSSDVRVSRPEFQAIFKFLLAFLTKEKQIDALIEKLVTRFETISAEAAGAGEQVEVRKVDAIEGDAAVAAAASASADAVPVASRELNLCRDLSYCLTQLPFTLPALKKLLSLFRCYAEKLGDSMIYDNFMQIVARARKSLGKEPKAGQEASEGAAAVEGKSKDNALELKQVLDDLEGKIQSQHTKLAEDNAVASNARKARGRRGYGDKIAGEEILEDDHDGENMPPPPPNAKPARGGKGSAPSKGSKSQPAKKKSSKSRRKKVDSSDDEPDEESEEEVEVSEEDADVEPVKPKSKASVVAPKKGRKLKKMAAASDSDEE